MKTQFFYRSFSGISGGNESFLMENLEKGLTPGVLVGTIEVPKNTIGEQKYWASYSDDGSRFDVFLDSGYPIPVDDSYLDSELGGLAKSHIWQSNLMNPSDVELFLRDSSIPAEDKNKKIAIFVSVGFFPKKWEDETIYLYQFGEKIGYENYKKQMMGEAVDNVLKQPVWGENNAYAVISTMSPKILNLMEEHDRLVYSKLPLDENLEKRKSFLVTELKNIFNNGKDPVFNEWKTKMVEECGVIPHSAPVTKDWLKNRKKVGDKILKEILGNEDMIGGLK